MSIGFLSSPNLGAVPGAIGDFLILDAIRKSGGTAIAVSEEEISDGTKDMSKYEGIFPAPEGGAALAAFYQLVKSKFIKSDDSVVIFNTGSGYKYLDVLNERGRPKFVADQGSSDYPGLWFFGMNSSIYGYLYARKQEAPRLADKILRSFSGKQSTVNEN